MTSDPGSALRQRMIDAWLPASSCPTAWTATKLWSSAMADENDDG
jgi:hypothetical protein